MTIFPSGASDLVCLQHQVVCIVRNGVELCQECHDEHLARGLEPFVEQGWLCWRYPAERAEQKED